MKSSFMSVNIPLNDVLTFSNTIHRVQLTKSPNKKIDTQTIQAKELTALKQRVKQRNYNKENNHLYRSQFIERPKQPDLPKQIIKIQQHLFKHSLEDFQLGDLLGKGAQSKVRFAIHKKTGFVVSIKTIPRQKIEQRMEIFIRAMKIQFFLNHPNIAKIYGLIVEEKYVHLILEYCADGDLASNRNEFGKQNNHTKHLLYKIAKGLEHIHEHRIQHRDLKLENILMHFGVPKISDFQLSVYTKLPFLSRRTLCGSPAYFSPQMIQKHRYNKKADIWCLGIIFYELLCGYFPFQINNYDDVINIQIKQLKPFPSSVSPAAVELVTQMLNKDSEERISIDEVLLHQFFVLDQEE